MRRRDTLSDTKSPAGASAPGWTPRGRGGRVAEVEAWSSRHRRPRRAASLVKTGGSMKYVRWSFYASWITVSIGWVTIPIPHAEILSSVAGHLGIYLFLGSSIAWLIIRFRTHRPPGAVNVVRLLTFFVISLLLPYLVVTLASSGGTVNALFKGNGYNWQQWVVHMMIGGVLSALYGVLVELPNYLHKFVSLEKVANDTRILIPSWGSGIASVAIGALVLLMHFADGPLARTALVPVVVSGVAVATLLLPLLKWMITAIWKFGVTGLFNLPRWRETVTETVNDIVSTARPEKLEDHLRECPTCRRHIEECKLCQDPFWPTTEDVARVIATDGEHEIP